MGEAIRRGVPLCLLLVACGGSSAGPAATYVYAGGGASIDVFRADLTTGALTFQAAADAGDQAYLFEVDAGRRRAYLQTLLGIPVVIRTFDIQRDGALKPAGDLALPHPLVEGVSQIQIHPTAPWLLLSSTGGASGLQDQLFPVGPGGGLGMPSVISTDYYGFTWDPSGRYFFGLDGVAIGQFVFDVAAGNMQPSDPPQADGSVGRQFLALRSHPGGKWVYSAEEGALGLFTFDRGLLTAKEYLPSPLPAENTAWTSLAVDPTGRFLYALGYVREALLAFVDLFSIDATSGGLTFVRREKGDPLHHIKLDSLQAPLLVGPLLVVGGRSAAASMEGKPVLTVYRIDPGDGTLAAVGAPIELRPAATTSVNFLAAVVMQP